MEDALQPSYYGLADCGSLKIVPFCDDQEGCCSGSLSVARQGDFGWPHADSLICLEGCTGPQVQLRVCSVALVSFEDWQLVDISQPVARFGARHQQTAVAVAY